LCITLFLLLRLTTAVYAEDVQQIPLSHFAKLPRFSDPKVSPNGKRIAATLPRNGEPLLVVQKLMTPEDRKEEQIVPMRTGGYPLVWYEWANDDRLVINLRTTDAHRGNLLNLTRMVSIGRDGKNPVQFRMEPNNQEFYRQLVQVVSFLWNDPEHILATLDDRFDGWAAPDVDLVNVYTGKKKRVLRNYRNVYEWIADADGRIRIGVQYDTKHKKTGVTIYYRETEESQWEALQKVDYFDHDRLIPYRFDEKDSNILLVTSANLADDEEFDELEQDLFCYDLKQRRVIGPYKNLRQEKIVSKVMKALPKLKVKIVSKDKAKMIYIFQVYSDIQAPEYYLLDIDRISLEFFASQYPELADAALSPMERVSYKARDGLDIPAFLTIPNGAPKENLPVIIYPHGGPWVHDEWGFDSVVQFMANRGYAVFQPQFRGSTGYGIEYEEAGYGQWGHAIQDDITDGVDWLIKEGIADPGRIAIIGMSFGGYAAAMGVAKTPDLYQCAVSINGVLDLKMLIDSAHNMLFETQNRAVWNLRRGAEKVSPYHLRESINAPLLLIHSERDTVVPVKHSKKMYNKLKRLNKPVEYVELPDGEHWLTNEDNRMTVFKALERFLSEHMGTEAQE
jgi:dipeptidyl aminopeptidase/acylaminoacyl peptidase